MIEGKGLLARVFNWSAAGMYLAAGSWLVLGTLQWSAAGDERALPGPMDPYVMVTIAILGLNALMINLHVRVMRGQRQLQNQIEDLRSDAYATSYADNLAKVHQLRRVESTPS